DGAVINDEVDREDVWVVCDRDGEPAHEGLPDECPTIVRLEDLHAVRPFAAHCASSSVSRITRWTTPSLSSEVIGNPVSWKRRSILVLWGRVSATNQHTRARRARDAKASNIALPNPWPCHASATTNATSARSLSPIRSKRATPTMPPSTLATTASRSRWSTCVNLSTSSALSSGCTEKKRR